MHKTRNDLALDVRTDVSRLLNSRLASAIDLYLQTKHAHWNVKGPGFIALHELFDKLGEELEEHIDDIAERAVALGAVAEGTTHTVIERTQLAKYPAQISEGLAHVDALANAYAAFGKSVREAIDESAKAGDADTSDLFTGISRGIDKSLWFLEAHRQAER
ncbi:MAG TPA: DNA starvation/stationary phase protection protein Dps [Steroidobacteraceae bacterium]